MALLAAAARLAARLRQRFGVSSRSYQAAHLYACRPVLIVAAGGALISAGLFVFGLHAVTDHRLNKASATGIRYAAAVEQNAERYLEGVWSIPALFAASQRIERDAFTIFAHRLLANNEDFVALEWIPRVPAADRQAFEDAAWHDGFEDFQFTERTESGALAAAGQRDEYFPVYFVAPLAGNAAAMGFDLASNPVRLAALERARDTGRIAATSRIRLVQDGGEEYAVLAFAPIYEGTSIPQSVSERRIKLTGFGLGVIRMSAIVASANAMVEDHDIHLMLRDESAEQGEQLLHATGPAPAAGSRTHSDTFSVDFDFGGRTWSVSAAPISYHGLQLVPWGLLLTGLLLTGAIVQYVVTARTRTRNVERQVVDRTMEYAQANIALQDEIAERQRVQEHLIQSQKMEAIGQLTGGIAHDFNNLLMIIDGYARRAEKAVDPESKARTSLREVIKASEKAAKLTKQLLVFSRRQVMEKKVFVVSEALLEVEALLDRSVGESCELRFDFEDDSLCVHTDSSELTQAVLNLGVNARDAMQGGGTITIRTRIVDFDESAASEHQGLATGRYVEISVADSGSGISDWDRLHIFEPFFTTKEQGKGTGLGLAMVLGFAQHSGGTVTVDSALDQGTTIGILLPLAAGAVKEAVAEIEEDYRGRGETILVVDDDEALLALNSATVRELGYNVLTAEDGFCALEVEEECEGEIDLLLSDVVMPQMGGFELCEIIREKRPAIRTIFISGYPNRDSAKNTKMPENCQFLQKPVKPNHLAQTIRNELDAPNLKLVG